MALCSKCRSEMARFKVGSVVLGTSCVFEMRRHIGGVSLMKGDRKRNANKSIPKAPDSIPQPRLSLLRRGLNALRTLFTGKRSTVRIVPPQPQRSALKDHYVIHPRFNLPHGAKMVKQTWKPVKP